MSRIINGPNRYYRLGEFQGSWAHLGVPAVSESPMILNKTLAVKSSPHMDQALFV